VTKTEETGAAWGGGSSSTCPPPKAGDHEWGLHTVQEWLEGLMTHFHIAAPEQDAAASDWAGGVTFQGALHANFAAPASDPLVGGSEKEHSTSLRRLASSCQALDGPVSSGDAVNVSPAWEWLLAFDCRTHSEPWAQERRMRSISCRHELCKWPLPGLSEHGKQEAAVLLEALCQAGWAIQEDPHFGPDSTGIGREAAQD
jgi:hypothetical protein